MTLNWAKTVNSNPFLKIYGLNPNFSYVNRLLRGTVGLRLESAFDRFSRGTIGELALTGLSRPFFTQI